MFHSRPIPRVLKNPTVSRQGRHWFVSFQTKQVVADPPPQDPADGVGGDLGGRHCLVLADGTGYDAPRAACAPLRQRMARLQRQRARQLKGSQNWQKTPRRRGALSARVANRRRDVVQPLRTTVSQPHAPVALEDLRIGHLTASAKGTLDQRGTQVRQKAGRNRAIRERGWGLFVTLLAYKGAARGGQGIRVPAAYSSQEGPRPVPVLLPGTRVRDDGGGEGGGDDGRSGAPCLGTPCAPIPSDACHPPEAPGGCLRRDKRGPPDEAGTAPPLGEIPRLEAWGGCQHVGRRRARGLCRPRSLGSKGMAGP